MRAERTIQAIEQIINRKEIALRDRLRDANIVIEMFEAKSDLQDDFDALLYENYGVDLEERRV